MQEARKKEYLGAPYWSPFDSKRFDGTHVNTAVNCILMFITKQSSQVPYCKKVTTTLVEKTHMIYWWILIYRNVCCSKDYLRPYIFTIFVAINLLLPPPMHSTLTVFLPDIFFLHISTCHSQPSMVVVKLFLGWGEVPGVKSPLSNRGSWLRWGDSVATITSS